MQYKATFNSWRLGSFNNTVDENKPMINVDIINVESDGAYVCTTVQYTVCGYTNCLLMSIFPPVSPLNCVSNFHLYAILWAYTVPHYNVIDAFGPLPATTGNIPNRPR